MKKYLINLLISIDQFFNTVFAGDPDETISSRLGKRVRAGKPSPICDLLNTVDDNHCVDAIEEDEGKDAVHGGDK